MSRFLTRPDKTAQEIGDRARIAGATFLGTWAFTILLIVMANWVDIPWGIVLLLGLISVLNLVVAFDLRREHWHLLEQEA